MIKIRSLCFHFLTENNNFCCKLGCEIIKYLRLITGELCIHLINQQRARLISIFCICCCCGNKKITGTFASLEHFVCTDGTNSTCFCSVRGPVAGIQMCLYTVHDSGEPTHENSCPCWSNHPGGGSIMLRAFQALMVGTRPTTWTTSIRGVFHHDDAVSSHQEPAGLTTKATSRWVASNSLTTIRC